MNKKVYCRDCKYDGVNICFYGVDEVIKYILKNINWLTKSELNKFKENNIEVLRNLSIRIRNKNRDCKYYYPKWYRFIKR